MLNEGNSGDALPVLTNCVFWRNGSMPFVNMYTTGASATYSLFDNPANVNISGPGNLTTTTSPFLSETSVSLAACSPAINAGDPTTTTATAGSTDLAGNPRIVGTQIDMGAVEYQKTQYPARLYVAASQTATAGDGLSWTTAFPDLQSALTYPCSQSLTEIWVAAGTYKPTSNTADQSASFALRNGVRVYGGFRGNETTLTGRPAINPLIGQPSGTTLSGDIDNDGTLTGNSYHVFFHPASLSLNNTAVLDGVVITGGNAAMPNSNGLNDSGGGIFNTGCSPGLINCSLTGNNANINGGAIYNNDNSNLHIDKCSFQANTAYNGGAVYNRNSSPSLINWLGNEKRSIYSGGAFSNWINSSPTITGCTLTSNTSNSGGAVFCSTNSNARLTNCRLTNNTAVNGGGAIFNQSTSDIGLNNCILTGNTANYGGGICSLENVGILLTNCSLVNNTFIAAQLGGDGDAIYNQTNCHASLINTVVWGNGSRNAIINSNSTSTALYSLFDAASYIADPTNLTTATSPFASTTSLELSACSPAINAGNPASITLADGPYSATALPATDLAGNPRIVAGRVDIGAFESQALPVGLAPLPASATAVCSGERVSLPASVTGTVAAYQWYKNGSPVTSQTAAVLSIPQAGTTDAGTYSLVVTGTCNSVTSTAFSLTVNALPSVTVTAPPSTTLSCINPGLTLTATASTTALLWSTGQTTATISVSQTGTYSVTATGANGCSAVSNNLPLTENFSLPPFTVSSATVCSGQSVNLTASGCSGQILWSTGATTAMITLTAGSSTSLLTATCSVGACSTTASGQVVVGSIQPPPAQILSFTTDESACPVRLTGRGVATSFTMTGPKGYVFSTVYREGTTHEAIGLNVKQAGTYTLTATYTNSCGTSEPATRTVAVSRNCP